MRLQIRSMVGLIPLFAVETLEPEMLEQAAGLSRRLEWFLEYRPDLAALVSHWQAPGRGERRLLSLLRGHRMKRLLRRMLDETEFLSDYGVRALSRAASRASLRVPLRRRRISRCATRRPNRDSRHFGGNSNWRGPIWFPLNYLIIESLQKFHHYYGDDFKVECPTGSGRYLTIEEVADELARRLIAHLLRRTRTAAARCCASTRSCRPTPTSATTFRSTNTSTATPAAASAPRIRPGWTALIAKLLMPRAHD